MYRLIFCILDFNFNIVFIVYDYTLQRHEQRCCSNGVIEEKHIIIIICTVMITLYHLQNEIAMGFSVFTYMYLGVAIVGLTIVKKIQYG